MNRAPIALCGLLCTLGSTLIAAGMAHDGSPCRLLPRPQPRIGVQATAPSRHPLASYDPTERWLDPALWRQADLIPVERRHETVVPTPVRQGAAALKSAAIKPAVTRAVKLPVGHVARSPLPGKLADVSLPRLVRAAELASQTEATLRWIAAQDGIDDSTGVYVRGSQTPLSRSVLNAFAVAGPHTGSITPWTVGLHIGPASVHVFDSNLGFDNRGVRVVRSVSPVEPTLWMDSRLEIARSYRNTAIAGIARVSSAADQVVAASGGVIDIAMAARGQVNRTAAAIVARLPAKMPSWNLLMPTGEKPTTVGGKPAKLRSAELPGGTKK